MDRLGVITFCSYAFKRTQFFLGFNLDAYCIVGQFNGCDEVFFKAFFGLLTFSFGLVRAIVLLLRDEAALRARPARGGTRPLPGPLDHGAGGTRPAG